MLCLQVCVTPHHAECSKTELRDSWHRSVICQISFLSPNQQKHQGQVTELLLIQLHGKCRHLRSCSLQDQVVPTHDSPEQISFNTTCVYNEDNDTTAVTKKNKDQLSLTNLRNMLHHGARAANK